MVLRSPGNQCEALLAEIHQQWLFSLLVDLHDEAQAWWLRMAELRESAA